MNNAVFDRVSGVSRVCVYCSYYLTIQWFCAISAMAIIQLGSIGGSNPNYRYFLPLLLAVHIHIEQAFPTKINELTESQ